MVGQYCKSAPDPGKQSLVDQYFYKLTRTILRDSRAKSKVEPVFGYGSDMVTWTGSQKSTTHRSSTVPASRWATTPLRQSSRTPVVSTKRAAYDLPQQENLGRFSVPVHETDDVLQSTIMTSQLVQDERQSLFADTGPQSRRLDEQEETLDQQNGMLKEHEDRLSSQSIRIVKQEKVIKEQAKKLQSLELYLHSMAKQLTQLQEMVASIKADPFRGRAFGKSHTPEMSEVIDQNMDSDFLMDPNRTIQGRSGEDPSLRTELEEADIDVTTAEESTNIDVDSAIPQNPESDVTQNSVAFSTLVLGKRKRRVPGIPTAFDLNMPKSKRRNKSGAPSGCEQMPTPQSSDGGQCSPTLEDSNDVSGLTEEEHGINNSLENMTPAEDEDDIDKGSAAKTNKKSEGDSNANKDSAKVHSHSVSDQVDESSSENTGQNCQQSYSLDSDFSLPATSRPISHLSVATPILEPSHDQNPVLPAGARRLTRSSVRAAKAEGTSEHQASKSEEAQLQVSKRKEPSNSLPAPESGVQPSQEATDNAIVTKPVVPTRAEALLEEDQPIPNAPNAMNENLTLPVELDEIYNDAQSDPDSTMDFSLDNVDDDDDDDDDEDDDDDLMTFGNGDIDDESLLDESVRLSGWHHTTISTTELNLLDNRDGRSMAPEPIQRPRGPKPIRTYITLDNMYLCTPKMFEEAKAEGRRVKQARPSEFWTGRERILNEELIRLGLGYWVGKRKHCKEYRELVTAARARVRNQMKAVALQSKGLTPNFSDSSSMLPETITTIADTAPLSLPLTETTNVPNTAPVALEERLLDLEGTEPIVEELENKAAPVRISSRRKSAPQMFDSSESHNKKASSRVRRARPKSQSYSRRQSKRKSEVVLDDQEEVGLGPEQPTTTSTTELTGSTDIPTIDSTMLDEDSSIVLKQEETMKPVRRTARSRKFIDAESTRPKCDGQKPVSTPPSTSATTIPQGHPMSREDAIRLRDSIAKALMEKGYIVM